MDSYAAADRAHLAVLRALGWGEVLEPVDRAAAITELTRRLAELADRQAVAALEVDTSYAALGRALGISRQAARTRYGQRR